VAWFTVIGNSRSRDFERIITVVEIVVLGVHGNAGHLMYQERRLVLQFIPAAPGFHLEELRADIEYVYRALGSIEAS